MSKCSINVKKIAKKFVDKQHTLSDLERVVLLYVYYNELLEDIDQDNEEDVALEEEIINEWVTNLFFPPEDAIDVELAALSVLGSK